MKPVACDTNTLALRCHFARGNEGGSEVNLGFPSEDRSFAIKLAATWLEEDWLDTHASSSLRWQIWLDRKRDLARHIP